MYCCNCMNQIGDDGYCPHCQKNIPQNIAHHLIPGTVLNNKYLIGNALGEGGFGITYIGRDLTLDVRVAVKEYYPSGYVNRNNTIDNSVAPVTQKQIEFVKSGKERFLQEARSLAKLADDKGVVLVRDYFEGNGTAYIVMEYLDGITLQEYLKQYKTIEAESIFKMMQPMITSLERMHNAHIIHRDISPDNIMVLRDGTLKLMDFGSARYFTNGQKDMSVMIKKGYAPEEQYRRSGDQGPWTDVYGLCATIYKCITGDTPEDSLNRMHSDTLKKPSEMGVVIDPQLEATLMYGLAVRREDRCQNMTELKHLVSDALNHTQFVEYAVPYSVGTQLLDTQPANYQKYDAPKPQAQAPRQGGSAPYPMTPPPEPKKKKKSAAVIIIIILCVLLAIGLGVLIYLLLNQSKSDPDPVSQSGTEAQEITDAPTETAAPADEETSEAAAELIEVPDVVGQQLDKAISGLTNSDLKPVCDGADNNYENYKVVGQYPKAGDQVEKGAEITLYISKESDDSKEIVNETTAKNESKSEEPTYPSELNGGEIESLIAKKYSSGKTLYCRAKESVTLREKASRYGEPIKSIPRDAKVTYLASINDFYKVKYNGKEGYVLAKYFSDDPDAATPGGSGLYEDGSILFCVANEYLTLRESPSSSSKGILLIKRGEAVRFIKDADEDKSFAKITYNGHTGYVIGRYLNDDKDGDILPETN